MIKKILSVSGVIMTLAFAVPVLVSAEGTGVTAGVSASVTARVSAEAASNATKIACVATAVATREASIDAAVSVHAQSVQAAYTTRATELAGAYSNTTIKGVQAGVKVSWADFTKSVRTAQKTWATSRNAAWTTFRAAVKACKAPSSVSDSSGASAELSGQ